MGLIDTLIQWDKAAVLAVNSWHTPVLDRFFWLISETAVWLPFFLVFLVLLFRNKKSETLLILLFLVALVVFTDQVSSSLIKPLVGRYRPTHDMQLIPLLDVVNDYHGGAFGFLSSHAANLFGFAVFSSLLLKHWPYTLVSLLWAGLVSFSRCYLAVHYPTDLFCGALLGTLAALLLYVLYIRITRRSRASESAARINKDVYTASLYQKKDIYLLLVVMAVSVATLLLASNYLW